MIAIARQAVPRGTPCEYCGKPIRTGGHPKGWGRKYCDRILCARSRINAVSLAAYYRDHAVNVARQRALYDPEKRRQRAAAMTPAQLDRRRAYSRRFYRARRTDILARAVARYDPEKRRQRYLATGT